MLVLASWRSLIFYASPRHLSAPPAHPGPPHPAPAAGGAALPLPAAGGRWRGHVVLRIVPSLFCSASPGGRASPGPAPREGGTADPDPRPRQRPWQACRPPSPPRPTAASPKLARQRATLSPGCAEREESENIKKKIHKIISLPARSSSRRRRGHRRPHPSSPGEARPQTRSRPGSRRHPPGTKRPLRSRLTPFPTPLTKERGQRLAACRDRLTVM